MTTKAKDLNHDTLTREELLEAREKDTSKKSWPRPATFRGMSSGIKHA